MSREFLQKKIEQIVMLLRELHDLLDRPFDAFKNDSIGIHAAERDFQLTIDLASDINTHILVELQKPVPDTYRRSFMDISRGGILSDHFGADAGEKRGVAQHPCSRIRL